MLLSLYRHCCKQVRRLTTPMMPSRSREASHAGSWYTDDGRLLAQQLDGWLDQVPDKLRGIAPVSNAELEVKTGPVPGARVIIAPHAGYSYSGPAAAWAYKSLDLSKAKRVFILGPSHHHYLSNCALSRFASYSTPLGPLTLDQATIDALHGSGSFDKMSPSVDEAEHSIEMHLPYLYHCLSRAFPQDDFPPIIPILVGNTSPDTEQQFGKLLAPYLADPSNAFIVSSDFAHWGSRFRYTFYRASRTAQGQQLKRDLGSAQPRIWESIADVDMQCIEACETGSHEAWLNVLEETGNTVCGRHPIGIVMAGLEELGGAAKFKFVRYERSSDVETLKDSSVSYCSAYAVL